MVYVLNADIKQPMIYTPNGELRPLIVTANGGNELSGSHGCHCWWISLGDGTGLKIFNHIRNKSYDVMATKLKDQSTIIDDLYKRCSSLNKHLPIIIDNLLVKYSGTCELGGTQRKGNKTFKDVYMIALLMKEYKLEFKKELMEKGTFSIKDEQTDSIKKKFLDCGIDLEGDVFYWGQLGIDKDNYILLDIETTKESKHLAGRKIL